MRKSIFAGVALASLLAASAAAAGDIVIVPNQVNHPYPAQSATTNVGAVLVGTKLNAGAAAVGNILTADSNGNISVQGVNTYSQSQYNDTTGNQAQTGTTNVVLVGVAGKADISSNGLGNQMGLRADGYVNVGPLVTQQNQGRQVATTNVALAAFGGKTSISSGAVGNVLTAEGYGVTLGNTDVYATQSSIKTQVATTNVAGVLVGDKLSATSQAGANALELTAYQAGVTMDAVQANGYGYGTGLNQIAGYPGSEQTATTNLTFVYASDNATVGANAFGNSLTADASFGGSITGALLQNQQNAVQTATVNVSASAFGANLSASTLAVGNSASLKTH